MDFRQHRLVDLASRIRARELSAREVVGGAIEEIERTQPTINSFVCWDPERALADAATIDQRLVAGESVGPLAGIPLGVKDLEDAAGFPTRMGSLVTSDEPAEGDSVLVARLRAAGCVVVGRTTTPEFGHKGTTESPVSGETRNPWNTDYTPGGSSGGSGAALAAGVVPLATGSDGGGSIRLPSAICGLSGIKTTQGRIPNGGPKPPGHPLFAVKGPMARHASDIAFALDICVGPHPTDNFSLPRSGSPWYDAVATARAPMRVGWSPTMGFAEVDHEMAQIMQGAIDTIAAAGVDVVEVPTIWDQDPVYDWWRLWVAAAAHRFGPLLDGPDADKLDPSYALQVGAGRDVSATEVMASMDAIHSYNLSLETAFEQAPLLITPVMQGHAPKVGQRGTVNGKETEQWVGFTYGFNLTRNPAGVFSVGNTAAGVPVGLQIVGRHLDDVAVLQAVSAFENIFGPNVLED